VQLGFHPVAAFSKLVQKIGKILLYTKGEKIQKHRIHKTRKQT